MIAQSPWVRGEEMEKRTSRRALEEGVSGVGGETPFRPFTCRPELGCSKFSTGAGLSARKSAHTEKTGCLINF